MKKILCLVLLMITGVTLFAEKGKVKITGEIKGLGTNQVVVINMFRDRVATCVAEKGKFEMEFNYDLDGDLKLGIYIPHLDRFNQPQSNNVYMFEADAAGIRISGRIKGENVEGFKAISPINDDYNRAKYESPSAPLRLKAEKETAKAWKDYEKYRNPTGRSKDQRDPKEDPKARELRDSCYAKQNLVSEYNIKCSMEAVEALTPEMNTGLNAFIYATCRSLRYDLLKPIVEKYLLVYNKEVLENNYYTRELLNAYRLKAVRHPGGEVYDMDFVNLKGDVVKFSDFKGKYLYVNMYDLNYEPSMEEFKHILALEKEYQGKNIVFLYLNVNKGQEEWKEYCSKNQLSVNQINVNDKKEFFGIYKVNDLPRGILIDPQARTHTFFVGKLYGERDKDGKSLNNGKSADEVLKEVFK